MFSSINSVPNSGLALSRNSTKQNQTAAAWDLRVEVWQVGHAHALSIADMYVEDNGEQVALKQVHSALVQLAEERG
jgi:hypothetical protein